MIRVGIVDDEPLARRGVLMRLGEVADVEVIGECEDGISALAMLRTKSPDLVFLDVQMPGMIGLDVLAALEPAQRPLVILLTAHEGFAVRAFALNAVDYLLKPIDDARFSEALARARHLLRLRALDDGGARDVMPDKKAWLERFQVRIGHRILFIRADSVTWVGADGDYAVLHVGERTYMVRESLHQLAAQLDPRRFVRVHRSAIVRLDQVAELQPLTNRDALLRLRDGTPVRVSRTWIDGLLGALRAVA